MSDSYSIATIFQKYQNKVYRLALSITRNEKDAEDITQNTFLRIMDNLKNFRNQSRLSTWIYRIAYNEALMSLRKQNRQFRLSGNLTNQIAKNRSGLFVNWAKLPDKYLLDNELKERIDHAIRQMPIKYRMALLLHHVEGVSLKDSAGIMGLKINSLKTRLHRAYLIIKSNVLEYHRDRQIREEKNDKRCGMWTEFVFKYVLGYLPKRKQAAFKRHIKGCSSCNLFLATYGKAIYFTKALECQDLPIEMKDKIKIFLLKNKRTKH